MRKTLYDILEIPVIATAEAIEASHQLLRDELQGKADAGDQDARMRLVAVREAYQTLSEPSRRRAYDASVSARENPTAELPELARESPDGLGEKLQLSKSLVFKGAAILVLAAIGISSVISYRQAETERLERMRVTEARRQAIEMEKLAIERAKVEADAAAQQNRIELEMRRVEEAARAREAGEEQARVRAQQELSRAQEIANENRLQRERIQELTGQAKEQDVRAEKERKLANEKQLLRRMCQDRYGREDC